jgi:hypothetical protein
MDNPERHRKHWAEDAEQEQTNKQANKQTNKNENQTDEQHRQHQKNREWTQVFAKGKQFLSLIKYLPCHSYGEVR